MWKLLEMDSFSAWMFCMNIVWCFLFVICLLLFLVKLLLFIVVCPFSSLSIAVLYWWCCISCLLLLGILAVSPFILILLDASLLSWQNVICSLFSSSSYFSHLCISRVNIIWLFSFTFFLSRFSLPRFFIILRSGYHFIVSVFALG